MKAKKQTSQTACFVPLPSQTDAEAQFRKAIEKPNDGANSPQVDKFLQVMERVKATMRSFTMNDIAYVARTFELPYPETKELFQRWKSVMVQMCRVEEIQGVYDQPTYLFLQ